MLNLFFDIILFYFKLTYCLSYYLYTRIINCMNKIILSSFFLFFYIVLFAQNNPKELGTVNWYRNLQKAKTESNLLHKPILILFQEVPGCSTCKNYGSNVLSHPLVKEAIETHFVPLCVYNNSGGEDKKALDYFNEPSWNNPVVRIVDSNLKDIVTRINGDYSSYGLVSGMVAAMQNANKTIPEYLKLLESEFKSKALGTEKTTIGMYCFWSGEKLYGKLDGVVATKAGFMGGSEVVEVEYCPRQISLKTLINEGKQNSCADRIFSERESDLKIDQRALSTFRTDKENKYFIYNSQYKSVPMTSLQATRINSLLAQGKAIESLLSPRQIQIFHSAKNKNSKNYIGEEIVKVWDEAYSNVATNK